MINLRKVMLAVLLVVSLAAPSSIVQGAAWLTMLTRNIAERPVIEAVQLTFSGENPCKLCLAASKMREQESSQDSSLQSHEKKLQQWTSDSPDYISAPLKNSLISGALLSKQTVFSSEISPPPES